MERRGKRTFDEAQQLLELIHDWKIDFEEAPTLERRKARHWSSKHIFEQIRNIKAVRFDEYPPRDHSNQEVAFQKKILVRRLQANVARCRRENDNEAGWINNVANLVFENLNGSEFQCQSCKAYLWLPDFVALPSDPVAAQRLLRDHRHRKICICSAARRADVVRVHLNSPSIFSNKSDERVYHNDQDLTVMVDQKYKRPDRVYGLSVTGSFDQFRDQLTAYSPFSGKHTLFPFLVVEAKSGKSMSSWSDIEQQTALSIRTCLKIQTDLELESNQVLDCLVWFLCFQGEEWRLYLALPVNDRTKICDCWHGCISKADEALQLLLIVDWICFWARDVHRKAILKCLSGLEARETTPAATVFSSQEEWDMERNATRSMSLVHRPQKIPAHHPEKDPPYEVNDTVADTYELQDDVMQETLDSDGLNAENDSVGSNTVRSARDVVFRWKNFALPKDNVCMLRCLRDMAPNDTIQNTARALWMMLTDERGTVKTSSRTVRELLQESKGQQVLDCADEEPLIMFLACQYRLTETSWQVMCTYWCITCSQPAAQLLAELASVTDAQAFSGLNFWRSKDYDCLLSTVASFQRLDGKASATAAISQETYCIRARVSRSAAHELEWFKADRDTIKPRVAMLEALFRKAVNGQQTNLPASVLSASGEYDPLLSQLVATDDLGQGCGVILKRPESWPATCPLWCFLTFESGSQETVGSQITLALREKAIYTTKGVDPGDEQLILEWTLATQEVMQSIDAPSQRDARIAADSASCVNHCTKCPDGRPGGLSTSVPNIELNTYSELDFM